MKHINCLVFLLLINVFCLTLSAQNTVSSTGGNATGSNGTIAYTVGQIANGTFSATNGTIIQGVQQPYEISVVTGIENSNEYALQSNIYPNPTSGKINLIVESGDFENLRFLLYDINGILLQNKKVENRETEISMENFSSSVYVLKLMSNNKEVKVFKIVKR